MAATVRRVAEFVAGLEYDALDDRVVTMVTDAITDAIGTGLAGSTEPLAKPLLDVIRPQPAGDGCDLLGLTRTANPTDAALYNGTVIHALDFDDTAHPAYAHPSAHLVPVLLSLGRREEVSGRDLITAYVAGFEVEGRLGRVLNMGHYLRGWHPTGTFGSIAAAVAACSVLRLRPDQVVTALGIAASSASGLRANFGTMTKPLHAGLAASNGLRAALLAAAGFSASGEAFDGRFGFLDVHSTGDRDESVWLDLGDRWELATEHGLALKPNPSCGATHPAIEAASGLRAELAGDEIAEVLVGVNSFTQEILIYDTPVLPLEGKFSMQYCVASALVTGKVTLDTFTEAALADPAVRELLPKIRLRVADEVRDNTEFGAVVEVRTVDGRRLSKTVLLAEGKPARWLGRPKLLAKFADCAGRVLEPTAVRSAFARLQALPAERSAPAAAFDALRPVLVSTTRGGIR